MAIEYTFYGDADVSTEDLQDLMAAELGGEKGPERTVFRDGMYVTSYRDTDPRELPFGFTHRVTVTFHFANLADEVTENHNTALMVAAVLALFARYPSRGVLLFNGEEVVMQSLADGVVFSDDWEDWFENEEIRQFVDRHAAATLPQPLL